MGQTCATDTAASPAWNRIGAVSAAAWSRLMGAVRPFALRHRMHRPHDDALDALDARALRDIGAEDWRSGRDLERSRAELQWRIDSQFRG